jgi:hypothetical protein
MAWKNVARCVVVGACTLLTLAACGGTAAVDGPGGELRSLTGAHTRAVWVQGDGSDPRALGDQLVLMGLDTHDGKGERVILGERRSYVKPLLTPSGTRIVFSSRAVPGPPETFVANWDGTGLRKLADGFALDVWLNPVDDSEWVYVGTDNDKWSFATVTRFPIDARERRELVWNKSVVGMDGFKVSPDGRHASGLCPWPEAVVATLPNRELKKLGEGCWTSLTSARGLLFWYFDGAHRNVTMVDVGRDARWSVNLTGAPGFEGAEAFHPRWTNHPRFLTISGPYNQGGANQARTGGKQVEVYVGRFSADYSTVEAWARATNNSAGDSYPDVWIDVARSPHSRRPSGPIGPQTASTPAARSTERSRPARLAINARLTRPGPIPSPSDILPYRHALTVNEYEIVNVIDGTYDGRVIHIAQWVIRDSQMLPGARRSAGASFTLTVERYDEHPELEGERLISDRETSGLPLYYDTLRP